MITIIIIIMIILIIIQWPKAIELRDKQQKAAQPAKVLPDACFSTKLTKQPRERAQILWMFMSALKCSDIMDVFEAQKRPCW